VRVALLLLLLFSGCVAYNDTCAPPSREIVGETLRSLELRQSLLQTREAPVGNLVADAVLAETPNVDIALVPASIFDADSGCGPRDFIDRGHVYKSDTDALLPGKDTVIVLTVTSDDLKRVLEHSVAQLATSTDNPYFLQVAGLLFTADCAENAQTLTPDGKDILFPGARVPAESIFVKGEQAMPGQTFKLATVSSLVGGGSGYIDLSKPGHNLLDTLKTPRDLLADHLRKASPVDPAVEARISLRDSCTPK
jgi:2',3'-cyclic-nucleotide 2'-phosphodiesterase (5'-nucleotidase family)